MTAPTSKHTYDIIIIGAGPAGLCLGQHLKENGVKSFCILEKGPAPGDSWSAMPEWLRLISYWQDNYLRPQDEKRFAPYHQASATEFSQYLRELSNGLEIHTHSTVSSLQKEGDLFSLGTTYGELKAKAVVLCVGYYSEPVGLDAEVLREATIPVHHFADMRGVRFEAHKKYLVVGKALSAGQVIEQIHDVLGRFDISCRSEIKFGLGPLMQKFFLRHLERIENLIRKISRNKSSKVPMDGTLKAIIKNAKAEVRPPVSKVQGKTVYFKDGTHSDYEGIVLATGFRYAGTKLLRGFYREDSIISVELTQLVKGFEAPLVPHLYFLGVDNQVDFTSRFLRGIRRDARVLAQLLKTQ
ncbi:NAD(P)-binding domain-containing protein [Bdellovibrio sp. HCB337]|uniref:NAD(P)-binding domain-containing protein n=1 Tax=Bdellovibrio sp. HCB337 TaxID=3394358 RepID=UPI0039A5F15F